MAYTKRHALDLCVFLTAWILAGYAAWLLGTSYQAVSSVKAEDSVRVKKITKNQAWLKVYPRRVTK